MNGQNITLFGDNKSVSGVKFGSCFYQAYLIQYISNYEYISL